MKIDINRIPLEGLTLEEEVDAPSLDLETDIVSFRSSIKIKAEIFRITNALTVSLQLSALMYMNCSRCFDEFEADFKKCLKLNYTADKSEPIIDLNPDIRAEIILDYTINPLCSPNCKGLCPKCGKNWNEGECKCVSLTERSD